MKIKQIAKADPSIKQDTDYEIFANDLHKIQYDLNLPEPINTKKNRPVPIPVEDLQNLTTAQAEEVISKTE